MKKFILKNDKIKEVESFNNFLNKFEDLNDLSINDKIDYLLDKGYIFLKLSNNELEVKYNDDTISKLSKKLLENFIEKNNVKNVFYEIKKDDEFIIGYKIKDKFIQKLVMKKLLKEESVISYWITDSGKFVKVKGEHIDYILRNLHLFGLKSDTEIFEKGYTEVYDIPFTDGWIRITVFSDEIGIEFWDKYVSRVAISTLYDFLLNSLHRYENVYFDSNQNSRYKGNYTIRNFLKILDKKL